MAIEAAGYIRMTVEGERGTRNGSDLESSYSSRR
jgi:hypothetical protein